MIKNLVPMTRFIFLFIY